MLCVCLQDLVFFHDGGKQSLHKLGDLVAEHKITSIARHGSFPDGACPAVLTAQGQKGPGTCHLCKFPMPGQAR